MQRYSNSDNTKFPMIKNTSGGRMCCLTICRRSYLHSGASVTEAYLLQTLCTHPVADFQHGCREWYHKRYNPPLPLSTLPLSLSLCFNLTWSFSVMLCLSFPLIWRQIWEHAEQRGAECGAHGTSVCARTKPRSTDTKEE